MTWSIALLRLAADGAAAQEFEAEWLTPIEGLAADKRSEIAPVIGAHRARLAQATAAAAQVQKELDRQGSHEQPALAAVLAAVVRIARTTQSAKLRGWLNAASEGVGMLSAPPLSHVPRLVFRWLRHRTLGQVVDVIETHIGKVPAQIAAAPRMTWKQAIKEDRDGIRKLVDEKGATWVAETFNVRPETVSRHFSQKRRSSESPRKKRPRK